MYLRIEDRRAAFKRWYQKNKLQVYTKNLKRRRELQAWLDDYKKKLKCSSCGESDYRCIDFHHISDDKEYGIAGIVSRAGSKSLILKEIAKCIPVCANCHRKITFKYK